MSVNNQYDSNIIIIMVYLSDTSNSSVLVVNTYMKELQCVNNINKALT